METVKRVFRSIVQPEEFLRVTAWLLAISFVFALLFLPLIGHDGSDHRVRILTYRELFGVVSWYPRWSHRAFFGWGSPVFYFYPPLTYVVTSLISFVLTNASVNLIFKIDAALSIVVAFYGTRWVLKMRGIPQESMWVGAALYALNPYTFFTLVTRGSLSELTAFALIPVCLGAFASTSFRLPFLFLIASVSLALIWISSVPVALGCSFILMASVAYSAKVDWRLALLRSGSIFFAVGMASCLLVPALGFLQRLHFASFWPTGDHSPVFEVLNGGFPQTRVFIPLISFLTFSIWFFVRKRNESLGFLWGVWTIAIILQLPFIYGILSTILSPLHLLQFPWRLNSILMFCSIIAIVTTSQRYLHVLYSTVSMVVVCTVITLNIFHITEQRSTIITEHPPEFHSRYMTGDSVLDVMQRSVQQPFVSSDAGTLFRTIEFAPYRRRFEVLSNQNSRATLNLYYWPEWEARIDGKLTQTSADDVGRTTLEIPKGVWTLDLQLRKSTYEIWGERMSLISFMLAIAVALLLYTRERRKNAVIIEKEVNNRNVTPEITSPIIND